MIRIDVFATVILIVKFVLIIVSIATTLMLICLTIIIVVIVAIVLILIIGSPSSSRPAPRAEISDLALQRIPQLKKARLYIIIMVIVAMTTIIATVVITINNNDDVLAASSNCLRNRKSSPQLQSLWFLPLVVLSPRGKLPQCPSASFDGAWIHMTLTYFLHISLYISL